MYRSDWINNNYSLLMRKPRGLTPQVCKRIEYTARKYIWAVENPSKLVKYQLYLIKYLQFIWKNMATFEWLAFLPHNVFYGIYKQGLTYCC